MSDDEQRMGDDDPLAGEAHDDEEERLQRELEVWGFFGGPAPSSVASTLDALCGVLPRATAHDRERASQRFFDGLEERLSRRGQETAELWDMVEMFLEDPEGAAEEPEIEPVVHVPFAASSATPVSTSAPTVPWPQPHDPRHAPTAPDTPAPMPAAAATDAAGPQVRKAPPAWVATTPSMDLSAAARALFPATQRADAPVAVVGPPKGFGHTLPLENPLGEIAAAVKAGAGAVASPSIKKEEQSPRAGEGIAVAGTGGAAENKNAAGAGATAHGAPSAEEWTVERYASLSVELSLDPDRAGVLGRYRVRNEAALAALVEHWNDRMAREPGLKAAVDAAKIAYTVWWTANRMGKGQGR